MASAGGQNEAILISNNLSYAKFNLCISSVCQLALVNGGPLEGKASGFLAKFTLDGSPKVVVVMNNHFVAREELASCVLATFKFEGHHECKTIKLQPDIFFTTDKELDYTFVGILEEDVNDLRRKHGVVPMKLDHTKLAVQLQDVIHIPQHPDGREKRISYSTVCKITQSEVFYKADTSFGSSGSPVLYSQSNNMYVLALHKDGGVTLPDGRKANRGILISAILDHICQHRHSESDEKPAEASKGASSSGKPESGADPTTTSQGLPVVQTQSEGNSPNTSSDAHSSNKQPLSDLIPENKSQSSRTSQIPTIQSPSVVQGPSPNCQILSESPFETKELIRIAQRISDVWIDVAKLTGVFKSWEITNINVNHTLLTATMKADQMLTDFKSRLGKREDLANAIHEAGKRDVAEKVRTGFYISNTD